MKKITRNPLGCSFLFLFAFVLISCGSEFKSLDNSSGGPNGGSGNQTPPFQEDPRDSILKPECTNLDFTNVVFPADFSDQDKKSMAIALNISGSYEGHSGWSNITNNFDGQGISMGLLNQNLGQGSLQPMLIAMRDFHMDVLQKIYTDDMLESMLKMLDEWEAAKGLPGQLGYEDIELAPRTLVSEMGLRFDGDSVQKSYALESWAILPHNKASVKWSVNTLYKTTKGKTFKPQWKRALKEMMNTPEYISIQIKEAKYLHDRALRYQRRLGFTEIRGYFFLFDIAVQNGTLKQKHFNKFATWKKKNPKAKEEKQMLELLEIRVVDSNPKWQNDVRRRKRTIITGTGRVHGEDRNMPKEFCYDQTSKYPQ